MNLARRVAALDRPGIGDALDARGFAATPPLLSAKECRALAGLYDNGADFRSRIEMARYGFGRGEYKYFAYPLPKIVAALRQALYPQLAETANRWHERLGRAERYPPDLSAWLRRCHEAGQTRPTPLLLRYGAGDYNCLHQDVYGALAFPLQATILLSAPGRDFDGGAFLLTEQRPRRQSRGEAVALALGQAVIFAVNERPVAGARGVYRVRMRHGVATLARGTRTTLGLIFHDAA